MSLASPIRIADAVVGEINSRLADGTFGSNDQSAQRTYADWDEAFEDLDDGEMSLDVVFRSAGKIELFYQRGIIHRPSIHVAIRKRFSPSDRNPKNGRLLNAAVDPLATLLEDIYKHFAASVNSLTLDGGDIAKWQGEESVIRHVDQAKLRCGMFEGYVEILFEHSEDLA